jgi:hypothetical protein
VFLKQNRKRDLAVTAFGRDYVHFCSSLLYTTIPSGAKLMVCFPLMQRGTHRRRRLRQSLVAAVTSCVYIGSQSLYGTHKNDKPNHSASASIRCRENVLNTVPLPSNDFFFRNHILFAICTSTFSKLCSNKKWDTLYGEFANHRQQTYTY